MKLRESVFCPKCFYIVEKRPSLRRIGIYRMTLSRCPMCRSIVQMQVGRVAFDRGSFVHPPPKKYRERILRIWTGGSRCKKIKSVRGNCLKKL